MTVVAQQKEQLRQVIREAIEAAQASGELILTNLPEIGLEVPRETGHGDFASNIALVTAKDAKKPPREVAQIIVGHLTKEGFIEKVEIAGPGFINFFLSNEWLYNTLRVIEAQGLKYGDSQYGQGE
ncbi:MAG: arginine--tRNA ligase, partial [Firmicutes bacterium]|nr:arginine--tRNA ligase [Bacillota bacterium]